MREVYHVYQYFGSKYRLVNQLTGALLHGNVYVEPFAGSAAIYLNRALDCKNVLCDHDATITNMWRVVADKEKREEFFELFLNTPVDNQIFKGFMNEEISEKKTDIERAVMTYYILVYSFDGNRKNMRFGSTPEKWNAMREKAVRDLKSNWTTWYSHAEKAEIINDNALKIIRRYKDREDVVMMLDPPYVKELIGKYCKDLYRSKFSDSEQHELLGLIRDARAKILLCGYRGGTLLYDQYLNKDSGWHCYCINDRLNKSCRTTAKKGFAKEYIWVNYELPADCRYYFPTFDLALEGGI